MELHHIWHHLKFVMVIIENLLMTSVDFLQVFKMSYGLSNCCFTSKYRSHTSLVQAQENLASS